MDNNKIDKNILIREGIKITQGQVDDSVKPEKELILQNIIGRKAFNYRNNLFYDYDDRAVYLSGANLVITDFISK